MERVLFAHPPVQVTPDRALRVLLLMAKRSHDDEPYYYGGLSHLMLNMPGPAGPNKRRTIMRYLAALQDAGYITATEKRVGHRRVYELHLPGL